MWGRHNTQMRGYIYPVDNTRFAKVPVGVIFDPRLSNGDVRVYAALAFFGRFEFSSASPRLIADRLSVDRRNVRDSLKRLSERGHIEAMSSGARVRRRYQLTPAAAPLVTHRREQVTCGRCGERCFGLLKVGWCRACNWRLKVERVVDSRLEARPALQLGPNDRAD